MNHLSSMKLTSPTTLMTDSLTQPKPLLCVLDKTLEVQMQLKRFTNTYVSLTSSGCNIVHVIISPLWGNFCVSTFSVTKFKTVFYIFFFDKWRCYSLCSLFLSLAYPTVFPVVIYWNKMLATKCSYFLRRFAWLLWITFFSLLWELRFIVSFPCGEIYD